MGILQNLEENVGRLKKNREKVPIDELKTRYAKGYNALLEAIRKDAEEMAKHLALSGCDFLKSDWPAWEKRFMADAGRIIEDAKAAGILKKYSQAIFRDYNIEKAAELILVHISEKITQEAYRPYWNEHCHKENGRITNDIIDMEWNEELKLWIKKTEQGWSWTIKLPPPEEMR